MLRDRPFKNFPMVKANISHLASVASGINHLDADIWLVGFVAVDNELAIADDCRVLASFLDIGNVL